MDADEALVSQSGDQRPSWWQRWRIMSDILKLKTQLKELCGGQLSSAYQKSSSGYSPQMILVNSSLCPAAARST